VEETADVLCGKAVPNLMMKPQIPENKWIQSTPDGIENHKGLWGGKLFTFSKLPSTNTWAKKNLPLCRNGDIIVARHQTEGRGRFSRFWFAPDSKCLTLSVVLSQSHVPENSSQLGQLAALAIRKTLDGYNIDSHLKWPNDVYASEKKIAGILSELDSKEKKVVLGIGLNVNISKKDLSLAGLNEVTSMMLLKGTSFPLEAVQKNLLSNLEIYFQKAKEQGILFAMTEWSKHDWLSGCTIEIIREGTKTVGLYNGLDDKGRLCVRSTAEKKTTYFNGDVRKINPLK
jgi:BirA family biotin operon repressor/biotin-[acetyl-CoA-carboxylase] ligase